MGRGKGPFEFWAVRYGLFISPAFSSSLSAAEFLQDVFSLKLEEPQFVRSLHEKVSKHNMQLR
jgi:hypothetical protein